MASSLRDLEEFAQKQAEIMSQQEAIDELGRRGQQPIDYKYGGDTGIYGPFMGERRPILRQEQSMTVGYNSDGSSIIETIPAQYGPSEYDSSYAPARRGLSKLNDFLFGDANEQSKAFSDATSLLRAIPEYAKGQYEAGMAGGTIFDPKTQQLQEFDPTSMAIGSAPGGVAALRAATPGTVTLGAMGGNLSQRLKIAREKYESSPNDKALRDDYYNIRRERDSLGESVDQGTPEIQPIAEDYRGVHQPPDREYGASLDDLTTMIPEDVYGASGPRLYGLGDPEVDREAFASLNKARGNPRQEVPVYRAVPTNVDNINDGDWVTTSRRYAEMHGDNALGGDYKILEQKARAGDLQSEGYPYEFGFNPLDLSGEARMARAQDLGFDTNRTAYRGIYGEYDPDKAGHYQMFTSSPEDAGEYGNSVISTYLKRGKNLVVDGGRNNFNSIPISQLPDEVRANLHSTLTDVARTDDIAHAAQAAGYDSVSINNVFDKASNEIPMKPAPNTRGPMSQEMIDILNEVEQSGMYPGADFGIAPEMPKNYDPVTVDIIFDPKNIRSTNADFDPTKAASADLLSGIPSGRSMAGVS